MAKKLSELTDAEFARMERANDRSMLRMAENEPVRFGREQTAREKSRQARGRGVKGGESGTPESLKKKKKKAN